MIKEEKEKLVEILLEKSSYFSIYIKKVMNSFMVDKDRSGHGHV